MKPPPKTTDTKVAKKNKKLEEAKQPEDLEPTLNIDDTDSIMKNEAEMEDILKEVE